MELMRAENLIDLKKHNSARYATVVGHGRQRGISTCVSMFPQEQSAEGVQRLQCVAKDHFTSTYPDGKAVHSLALRFASTRQAQTARDRIIEEHKGGAWPPFVVA